MSGQEAVDAAVAESARTGGAVNVRQCLRIARYWERAALEADTEKEWFSAHSKAELCRKNVRVRG